MSTGTGIVRTNRTHIPVGPTGRLPTGTRYKYPLTSDTTTLARNFKIEIYLHKQELKKYSRFLLTPLLPTMEKTQVGNIVSHNVSGKINQKHI
jgi:hypothetical protein